ncbi:MAG: hypothetical protein P8M13_10095, partial [Luminiphilus sp.]|nr:hypothetical protein [Luminiphilus sp.]
IEEAADPANLLNFIKGARGIRGGSIASEAGVRAALEANVQYIVGEPTLPILLAAIRAAEGTDDKIDKENR